MAKDWALVYVLENGQTAVKTTVPKGTCIELLSYGEVMDEVNYMKPGAFYYALGVERAHLNEAVPADLITEKLLQNTEHPPIRIMAVQGIPRSDYDFSKHDSYHLEIGPHVPRVVIEGADEIAQRLGLLADINNPGSALDVMDSINRALQKPIEEGTPARMNQVAEIIRQAHPIIWSKHMTEMASDAVDQLEEPISADEDLMFLNPMLWLYCEPRWSSLPAEKCFIPVTHDGHIPFPDERVLNGGESTTAILFWLHDNQIDAWMLGLLCDLHNNEWKFTLRRGELKLGAVPEGDNQNMVKTMRFAASPYLIVQRYQPRRTYTRRADGRFPVAAEGIGVILLRHARYIQQEGEKGHKAVPWSCQWWVSGHWTHQPCGLGRQSRKLIWIAPYIKGPPDKPLKEAVRLMMR